MKAFRVQGIFRMGRQDVPFTLETASADEDAAREQVFSGIGSRHRVERRYVRIATVTQIKPEEVTDLAVQHHLTLAAAKGGS